MKENNWTLRRINLFTKEKNKNNREREIKLEVNGWMAFEMGIS